MIYCQQFYNIMSDYVDVINIILRYSVIENLPLAVISEQHSNDK